MRGSIPTSTSSSGWLDRLLTSKGFPIPSHLDLEHFLHSNFEPSPNPTPPEDAGPPASNSPVHRKTQQSHETIGHGEEQRLLDLMNNVLSELFVMGDPRESGISRKSVRKQMNPRVCLAPASACADVGASRQVPAVSPSSADNSVTEEKRDRRKMKKMRASAGQAAGLDPSVNTGTVVTVIDTSSPGWKSERNFRKGMSWEGKEKKLWNVCRKKRKMGLVEKLVVEKKPLMELKGREHNGNVKSLIDVELSSETVFFVVLLQHSARIDDALEAKQGSSVEQGRGGLETGGPATGSKIRRPNRNLSRRIHVRGAGKRRTGECPFWTGALNPGWGFIRNGVY